MEDVKGRGRPKQTRNVIVKRNMNLFNITEDIALDRAKWRKEIYVTDAT